MELSKGRPKTGGLQSSDVIKKKTKTQSACLKSIPNACHVVMIEYNFK